MDGGFPSERAGRRGKLAWGRPFQRHHVVARAMTIMVTVYPAKCELVRDYFESVTTCASLGKAERTRSLRHGLGMDEGQC